MGQRKKSEQNNMDKDRGLSMNNDEQGLQTRLAAHARAQAQAGSGNLGAVKRALNNGNNRKLVGSCFLFCITLSGSKTQV